MGGAGHAVGAPWARALPVATRCWLLPVQLVLHTSPTPPAAPTATTHHHPHPPCPLAQVILAGRGAERCAATDEAVLQFCSTLPDATLHDALAVAERVSDIRTYERTANFRR